MHTLKDLLLILLAIGYTFGAMLTLAIAGASVGNLSFWQVLLWPIFWVMGFFEHD